MKELPTTASLFLATIITTVSFTASIGFGPKTAAAKKPASQMATNTQLSGIASVESSDVESTIVISLRTATGTPSSTNAALDAAIFTDSKSVSAYYKENSYGLISLQGKVVGPFTISLGDQCRRNMWGDAADAAATAAGVDLSFFKHKVYIEPRETINLCGGAGQAVGRDRVFMPGHFSSSRWMIAHELGHNFGSSHAGILSQEYGDYSSTMGGWISPNGPPSSWNNTPHFNAPEKIQMGWVPARNVQTVTIAGNYRVALLETSSTDVQVLKIHGANSGTDDYYFSYRRPVGFDSPILANYADNTSVHRWSGSGNTYILSNIADGQTFTDASGLSVTQTKHDATYAYLSVSFTAPSGDSITPVVSASPMASGSPMTFAPSKAPPPKVREIGSIPGVAIDQAVPMPNGRVVLYIDRDSIVAYDFVTKRGTLVTRGFDGALSLSRAGDRIAYAHESEDKKTDVIWSMPIDPKTGVAVGPAQRVSPTAGYWPSFSPNGEFIAFVAQQPNRKSDLVVVPTAGGGERVLAKYDTRIRMTAWSADGQWIFFGTPQIDPNAPASVGRIPAAGGQSESLISYRAAQGFSGFIAGLIAFYRSDPRARSEGRIAYVTASGTRGEFQIPPAASGPESGFLSAQTLLTLTTRPSAARILNLADGTVRDLLSGNEQSRAPVWSPDGHRLALQTGTGEHYEITVMNADGSQPRRYPVRVYATAQRMRWSPNGEMLAYYANAGATMLGVLDVATGKTRVVSYAQSNGFIPDFMWRPDGKSIVLVKHSAFSEDALGEVYEAGLDGNERKLRDIDSVLPASSTNFISDQLLLVGTASEQYTIPTSGGAPQKVPGTERRRPFAGVSNDGKSLLFLVENTDVTSLGGSNGQPQPYGRIASVELVTSDGTVVRRLSLPFEVSCCWNAPFHPDGRNIILVGKASWKNYDLFGESNPSKLFLVPLNGDAPRELARFSSTDDMMYLSPDGAKLVFTDSPPTSTIYELDVRPILKTLGKP